MIGILKEIENQGTICIVTIEIENRDCIFYAESRLFLNVISDIFGMDWIGQEIDFEVNEQRVIAAIQ